MLRGAHGRVVWRYKGVYITTITMPIKRKINKNHPKVNNPLEAHISLKMSCTSVWIWHHNVSLNLKHFIFSGVTSTHSVTHSQPLLDEDIPNLYCKKWWEQKMKQNSNKQMDKETNDRLPMYSLGPLDVLSNECFNECPVCFLALFVN